MEKELPLWDCCKFVALSFFTTLELLLFGSWIVDAFDGKHNPVASLSCALLAICVAWICFKETRRLGYELIVQAVEDWNS